MAKIIAVLNRKEGSGKTTICVHLGHALAIAGKRTLLVDMNIPDDIRIWLNAEQKDVTLFEVLIDGKYVNNAVVNVRPELDIIPSGGDNLGAIPFLLGLSSLIASLSPSEQSQFKNILHKIKLQGVGDQKTPVHEALKYALRFIRHLYDFILIDGSNYHKLFNAMTVIASDHILIPVSMDWSSVASSAQVNKFVSDVKKNCNHSTDITWMVPTFLDRLRNRVCDDILDYLKNDHGNKLTNPIRINKRISETPGNGKTVFDINNQQGIEDFTELAERVISFS